MTAKRNQKGQFEKGSSGNPGGRPKVLEEVRQALLDAGPDAVKALRSLLKHEDGRVKVAAAIEILTRILGKPRDSEGGGGGSGDDGPRTVRLNFVRKGEERPGHKPEDADAA